MRCAIFKVMLVCLPTNPFLFWDSDLSDTVLERYASALSYVLSLRSVAVHAVLDGLMARLSDCPAWHLHSESRLGAALNTPSELPTVRIWGANRISPETCRNTQYRVGWSSLESWFTWIPGQRNKDSTTLPVMNSAKPNESNKIPMTCFSGSGQRSSQLTSSLLDFGTLHTVLMVSRGSLMCYQLLLSSESHPSPVTWVCSVTRCSLTVWDLQQTSF